MFGNKRNNFPPRPHPPEPEHILEDLCNADLDDVAFTIMKKDSQTNGRNLSPNTINMEDHYEDVKTYLNVKRKLRVLGEILDNEIEQLTDDDNEIKRLADSIRKEAHAALVTP